MTTAMKRIIVLLIAFLLALPWQGLSEQVIDVDLAGLSDVVAYAQLYDMNLSPENYLGKLVRITGWFDYFEDMTLDRVYQSVQISDSTGCCSMGVEFLWAGEHVWPVDYPDFGTEITVCGRFEIYQEDGYDYIRLADAELTWNDL